MSSGEDSEMIEDWSDGYVTEEEDPNFVPVIPEKKLQKDYQVDFTIHSTLEILAFQQKEISHVSGILGCVPSTAATLLRYSRWNKEKLIESFMDDPATVCQTAGVIMDKKCQPKISSTPVSCEICYCESNESLALSCQHRFCKDCYQHYVTNKITQEGESVRITCPGNCTVIVDEKTIESLVPPAVYQKYQHLLMRTYVDDHPFFKWCPAPNCEFAVECKVRMSSLNEIVPSVTCKCSFAFCFGCSLPDHQPCICSLVRKWLKKCADDSETANWISANTKECSKCRSTIEKNGGCNHMTCRKCKYEFCWVCMGPWSEHGSSWYNCNRYEEKSGIDARDAQAKSRADLERYLHYFNRYDNHEKSAKLDKELYEKTERKMQEMQETSELSWIEVQFLKKAVEVLLISRGTLKWTYAFAYYLARNNATALFEDNQRDLEMAVEYLSELLEKPIDPEKVAELKQIVLDKTVYVSSRREILLTDTANGHKEGRWHYNTSLE